MKHLHQNLQPTEITRVRQIFVWARIGVHVLRGIFVLSFVVPFLDRQNKDKKIQKWSKGLLKILNIELQVLGGNFLPDIPHLIAANHISWLDIHVINALRPIRFVAKSEVEHWPIFGWMSKQLGTVFIRRDSARHARQVVQQMAEVLQTESICIFPEGTSTIGDSVLPFKPNLFESAIVVQAPVIPMVIQYLNKTTRVRSASPAFVGEMGLLESMANVIQDRSLVAQITILDPYPIAQMSNADRKQLAAYSHEWISKTL